MDKIIDLYSKKNSLSNFYQKVRNKAIIESLENGFGGWKTYDLSQNKCKIINLNDYKNK